MSEPADLYEILQVHPSAHPEVIQAAYRRLAQIYNPDRNRVADAAARMAEINRAYEVLRNHRQRAAYDRQRVGAGNSAGGATVADTIRAKSFQLVNDAGQTRAELSLDQDGDPVLVMNDRNGKRRFRIYQSEDGSQRLEINDRNGKRRLYVGESAGGRPMVYMTDRNGKRRFMIYQNEDGSQGLEINDRNGISRLYVGESADGTPMVYMADQYNNRRFELELECSGSPGWYMFDAQGTTKIWAYIDDDGGLELGKDS